MKTRAPSSANGLPSLLPLFLLISSLPLLTHWLHAQSASVAAPPSTCSIAAGPGGCPNGSCLKFTLETDSVFATATKCGYREFTGENLLPSNISTNAAGEYLVNGPPKFYLKFVAKESRRAYGKEYEGGGSAGWFNYGWSANEYTTDIFGNFSATFNWNPTNCTELSADYAGTYSATYIHALLGGYAIGMGVPDGLTNYPAYTETSTDSYSITNAATGQWDSGGYGSPFTYWGILIPPGSETLTHTTDFASYVTNWTYSDNWQPSPYPPDPLGYVENPPTNAYPTYYYSTNHYSGTNSYSVTNEFTNAMLTNIVLGKLGAFQTNWQEADSLKAWVRMEPYADTGTTNANYSQLEGETATANKFRARVRFQSESNATYNVTWTVTDSSGDTPHTTTVTGTGEEMIVDLGTFEPSLSNPEITLSQSNVALDEGEGAGSGDPALGSLGLKLGLGRAGIKQSAGRLWLHEERPSAALATPATLTFTGLTNLTEIIRDSNDAIRQAKAPQTLADVVTLTNTAYEVRFYTAANSGTLTNGLYVPTGSPFVVWGISQPDTGNTNLFRITETRGTSVITNDFLWAETNQSWTLTSGNGLRKETRSEVWSNTNTVRTVTRTLYRPSDNAVIAKSVEVSQQFPFGLLVTTNSSGNGTDARATTYTYYTDATNDGDNYGKLKTTVQPDGSWQWHEYDSAKRLAKTYSAFGNQSPTNSASLCRVTEYDYTPVGTGDDGTVQSWQPRTTIEKLLGTEIGRSYAVYQPNETSQIRCQTAGAAWDAADNLVTTTTTYSSGSFKGRTQSVRRPDGTLSLYEYSVDGAGNLSTLVWSGQPNGGGTAIVAGTKLVTLQGPLGNVIERTTVDIASTIVTGDETFSDFDDFGRPGRVTYLDSTFKLFTYICCGLESETDRDGVTTTYGYDALKRRITTTRNNISHITTLDAAGRTLFSQRQGTNGSTITLSSMVYDTAGRLLYQTNAVGNVTSFGESIDGSGQTVKTTINAIGATRIETYFKDGSLASVTGTAVHGVRYDYGLESSLPYTKEIKLLTNGTDSAEWTQTFTDIAGRSFKTVYPDSAYTQIYYNNAGQLWKQRDADGVVTLYAYNDEGQVEYTALDMDRNDTIDFNGTDRITRVVRDVVAAHSTNVRRTRSYVWTTASATNSLLTSTVESAVDGTRSWQTAFGLTSQSVSLCGGACVATNIAPDGSYTTTLKTNGYVTTVTRYDSLNSQLSATSYTYDEFGRQKTITDARNGTTTYIYDDADRVVSVTTPVPASGLSAQTTTSYFDDAGRVWKTVQPDGASVTNEFFLTGELKKTYGARTYPVEYTYDYAGRMQTLKTWQDFAGNSGTATTTWNYSTNRGFLLAKQYADGNGPTYTYTSAGRLATRVWARGITTTYTYDNAGQLTQTAYDDGITPTATTTYDRQGRAATVSDGTLTTTRAFNDAGQLLGESYAGGVLDGLSVTNAYDAYLRRTNLSAFNGGTLLNDSLYGYDSASRLATVSDGTNNATYGYLANSALVDSIVFKQNSTTRMVRTNRYDYLNRLTSITQSAGGSPVSAFNYTYNDANQRVAVTNVDNSRWSWGYDSLGQVTSGKRYWSDNTVVAGQQFEYAFDTIGNRTSASSGGSQFGGSLRSQSYAANVLNQYTNRTVPAYLEVQGSANSSATVTVNNDTVYRKGEYFRKELAVSNGSAAIWQGITNVAVLAGAGTNGSDIVTTQNGNLLLSKTPETFTYDADGNMTSDGKFTYTWDAENRLLAAESLTNAPAASRVRTEWIYQPDGRWSQRIAGTWTGSNYVAQSTNRFVWDGKMLLAVLDGDNQTTQAYLRGSDLSGSVAWAGGVGGLLAVSAGTNGVHFTAFDGNGNVSTLLAADGSGQSASYEYGPFGETLRATGPMALVNSLRFSTQFADNATGHLKYLYREYLPELGRWPNRDPYEEASAVNVFLYVNNSAPALFDVLGLYTFIGPNFVYGVASSGGIIGSVFAGNSGRYGATDDSLSIQSFSVELKGKSGCLCCIKELKLVGKAVVYLPSVGDTLPWNITATTSIINQIKNHELGHVLHTKMVFGSLAPNAESDCTGKCWPKYGGWKIQECYQFAKEKVDAAISSIMAKNQLANDIWHGINDPIDPSNGPNATDFNSLAYQVKAALKSWSKERYCDR